MAKSEEKAVGIWLIALMSDAIVFCICMAANVSFWATGAITLTCLLILLVALAVLADY